MPPDLARLAAAAGATQLGEAPGCHWVFSQEEMEAFLALVAADELPACPV